MGATLTAFGVHQYTDEYSRMNPVLGAGINVNKDTNLSIRVLQGMSDDYSAFGYYTLKDGKYQGYKTVDLTKSKDGIYNLGNFEAGTDIAFWLKGAKGNHINSLNEFGEIGVLRDSAYVGNNGNRNLEISLGRTTAHGYGSMKENNVPSENFLFAVDHTSAAPTGQPLPGVMTTLVIGAGVMGGCDDEAPPPSGKRAFINFA